MTMTTEEVDCDGRVGRSGARYQRTTMPLFAFESPSSHFGTGRSRSWLVLRKLESQCVRVTHSEVETEDTRQRDWG